MIQGYLKIRQWEDVYHCSKDLYLNHLAQYNTLIPYGLSQC